MAYIDEQVSLLTLQISEIKTILTTLQTKKNAKAAGLVVQGLIDDINYRITNLENEIKLLKIRVANLEA